MRAAAAQEEARVAEQQYCAMEARANEAGEKLAAVQVAEAAARKESSVSDDTLTHVSRYREEKVREARERREARGASGVMGRAREAWALVTKTTKKLLLGDSGRRL